jgi:hypothetical protein
VEAALSVAREEARAAAGKVEALATQLTAAEDALKVGECAYHFLDIIRHTIVVKLTLPCVTHRH